MRLADLHTPCLVLDRRVLARNLDRMAGQAASLGVPLRPHMKTAKSIDVARMAASGRPGAIAVSTLAEAEYFAAHGVPDILYAVCITPQKLDQIAKLNASGADIAVVTDDPDIAAAIAAHPVPMRALVEIDSGEGRSGLLPTDPGLLDLAVRLDGRFAGIMTHAGQSYAGRSAEEIARVAEAERHGAAYAAEWLRGNGRPCAIVSVGSTPTAVHGTRLSGVTELRAGVYMFGDLFQATIGSHGLEDMALTVLASVIGVNAAQRRLVLDAGGLALSKDRSTEATPHDYGFGLVLGLDGTPVYGGAVVRRAYQEHGVVDCDPSLPFPSLRVGDLVRVAPNHACMTAAAHDRYHVVEGGDEVVAVWTRVNGW